MSTVSDALVPVRLIVPRSIRERLRVSAALHGESMARHVRGIIEAYLGTQPVFTLEPVKSKRTTH
jgi:plasmid stability protein